MACSNVVFAFVVRRLIKTRVIIIEASGFFWCEVRLGTMREIYVRFGILQMTKIYYIWGSLRVFFTFFFFLHFLVFLSLKNAFWILIPPFITAYFPSSSLSCQFSNEWTYLMNEIAQLNSPTWNSNKALDYVQTNQWIGREWTKNWIKVEKLIDEKVWVMHCVSNVKPLNKILLQGKGQRFRPRGKKLLKAPNLKVKFW